MKSLVVKSSNFFYSAPMRAKAAMSTRIYILALYWTPLDSIRAGIAVQNNSPNSPKGLSTLTKVARVRRRFSIIANL